MLAAPVSIMPVLKMVGLQCRSTTQFTRILCNVTIVRVKARAYQQVAEIEQWLDLFLQAERSTRSQRYHIIVQRHLEAGWMQWFDRLTIHNQGDGTAVLSGDITDQAALHGVLIKIRDIGLPLLAVQRQDAPDQDEAV